MENLKLSNAKENKRDFNNKRMMNKHPYWYILGMILGLLLATAGIVLQFMDYESLNTAVPGVLMGIGSGMLGGCLAGLIKQRETKKNPELAHQKEIEGKDERNVFILDKAKSKAFSVMLYIYCGMLLLFTLLNVGTAVILICVAVLLIGQILVTYYIIKYNKKL